MMKNLYIFELSDVFANQVYFPYSSGVVWSYSKNKPMIKENYALKKWFYYRDDLEKIIDEIKEPDILAFSCFMWNWNLNCDIAEIIKKRHPKCLIVFGGQHQPLADRNEGFFQEYPYVDIVAHHEGEESFYEILMENLNKNPNFKEIKGITINSNGTEYRTAGRPRVKDLENVPSPYLDGSFMELLKNNTQNLQFDANIESARGCPFSCAFCEIGERYYVKVRTSYNKAKKEIEWLAQNQIEYVNDASSNFGMFHELDYDLAMYVKSIKEKFGYPHAYRVTWAKGKADKVLDIAKIFEDAAAQKGMTIALQSMNEGVLKAIKRKNIDGGKLREFIDMYEGENIASYVELIWGLPEETLETFVDGVCQIMEYGYHNYLDIHLMMLLPNAPIGSQQYIEKYGIKTSETQPRFSHRHITDELVNDTVQFVTETNAMTSEEWIEGHQFRWAVIFGHYLGTLQFLARGMNKIYDVSLKEFYLKFLEYTKNNPNTFIGNEYSVIKSNLYKILGNERHWGFVVDGAADINWYVDEATCIKIAQGDNKDTFYKEIKDFLYKNYPFVDDDIMEELFKYQMYRLSDPFVEYPFEKVFEYNIHDVIESEKKIQKQKNKILFNSKNYNSNLFSWAKEVLWFGRRVSKYKTAASLIAIDGEQKNEII